MELIHKVRVTVREMIMVNTTQNPNPKPFPNSQQSAAMEPIILASSASSVSKVRAEEGNDIL